MKPVGSLYRYGAPVDRVEDGIEVPKGVAVDPEGFSEIWPLKPV
ncbi:hypothetical protein [Ruminiclostridium josui]|nr:hypothetical protein [Ruminiclostridium josui]